MLNLVSRLSLTDKLVAIIVSINLIGLAAFATFIWRDQTSSSLQTASAAWKNSSEQFADLASGGVKWGKAEAVQDAYALYRDDPSLNLVQFAAFNKEGELIHSWSLGGTSLADPQPLMPAEDPATEATMVAMSSASSGYVGISVPIARDKKGRPIGSVVTSWATDSIYKAALTKIGGQILFQLVAISLAIGAFLLAMRAMVGKPLQAISGRINALQPGDYDAEVCCQDRGDEIGVVARALEHFRQQSIEQTEQERVNRENRETIERERAQNSRAIEENATQQQAAMTKLANAMESLAEGDFTVRLSNLGEGYEKITGDFNAMVDAVSSTLSDVADASGPVEAGSVALASSADELAKRTEQQAASLEETAAAVGQITETVKSSSAGATEAVSLVSHTKENAHSSANLVQDAIGAMSQIHESSGKIGQIIGVVDEIAFQTNLLALNAGVEAARAGEAGKGFAGVAQEVREPAQRSATAAKEIKDLVTASSEQVETGVTLVNSTGESLVQIEEQIGSIDTAIRAIVESYSEQSASLQEINITITNMDQSTQQNAAMVKETNAASQDLISQGQALKGSVSRFRLGASSAAPAKAEAHPAKKAPVEPTPRPKLVASGGVAEAAWEEF